MDQPENFKFDTRIRARALTQGMISEQDLESHLAALPDLEGRCDVLNLEQPALARPRSESYSAELPLRTADVAGREAMTPLRSAAFPVAVPPLGSPPARDVDSAVDDYEDAGPETPLVRSVREGPESSPVRSSPVSVPPVPGAATDGSTEVPDSGWGGEAQAAAGADRDDEEDEAPNTAASAALLDEERHAAGADDLLSGGADESGDAVAASDDDADDDADDDDADDDDADEEDDDADEEDDEEGWGDGQ